MRLSQVATPDGSVVIEPGTDSVGFYGGQGLLPFAYESNAVLCFVRCESALDVRRSTLVRRMGSTPRSGVRDAKHAGKGRALSAQLEGSASATET